MLSGPLVEHQALRRAITSRHFEAAIHRWLIGGSQSASVAAEGEMWQTAAVVMDDVMQYDFKTCDHKGTAGLRAI